MRAAVLQQQTASAAPQAPVAPFTPRIIQASSPNFNGLRIGTTLGCIVHSTNGPAPTYEQEFRGTLNWFANPASQVSAHIVIAEDGTIAEVVHPAYRAWHAGNMNDGWLGLELVKPAWATHITDEQLRSAAWWLQAMSDRYHFPLDALRLPEHRQTAQGRAIGKSDVGGDYSFERLKRFF